jgi:glycosyltransferase involved in cell wall biosynthesis
MASLFMRFLSLTFGGADCASSWYRIHALRPYLQVLGVEVECLEANTFERWDQLSAYDGVIVQKKLFNTSKIKTIRRRSRRLIYDIDDAIWLPQQCPHHWFTRWRTNRRLERIVSVADICFAANGVLARHLRPWAKRLEVLPMALDGHLWKAQQRPLDGVVRLGWSGAPRNLRYLESIEPALLTLVNRYPQARLVVLCGERPRFAKLEFEHVSWKPGAEPSVVADFDIGLLPLEDSPFAAGKSPIKGLQYLACGLPIVATPLEATRELLSESSAAVFASEADEWLEALSSLVGDAQLRRHRGLAGRAHFETHYTLVQQAETLHRWMTSTPPLN